MKLALPTIALLATTSAGAFGLGWFLKPSQSDSTGQTSDLHFQKGTSLTPEQRTRSDEGISGNRANSPIGTYLPSTGLMGSQDIANAIKGMSVENDPIKRAAMLTALLNQLTPENAKAAFEAMRETRERGGRGFGRDRGDEMRLLLNAWGRIDGKSAIAELTAIADKERAEREARGDRGGRGDRDWGGSATFDIYSVLSGWAVEDSSSALEYVNSLEGDDRRKGMYTSGIVRGLMVNGVDEAVEFISALPAGENDSRGRYMSTVAEEMLEQGVDSAAEWAAQLGDDDLKGGAMDRVASTYANRDLEGAVEWISKHADEDYARDAVTEIAEEWAEKDPQAVIDWADDLPEGTQSRVFEEALDEWTERDPVAASEYLAQMPASTAKDSAVEGFSKELARNDPEAAAAWAGTIGNNEIRISTLTDVARNWLRTDRAAAEAWLPTSGLSPDVQQNVLESRGGDRWGGDFRGRRGR